MLYLEYCPICDKDVVVIVTNTKDYHNFCPVCGNMLTLCSLCQKDGHICDYDNNGDNTCSQMRTSM